LFINIIYSVLVINSHSIISYILSNLIISLYSISSISIYHISPHINFFVLLSIPIYSIIMISPISIIDIFSTSISTSISTISYYLSIIASISIISYSLSLMMISACSMILSIHSVADISSLLPISIFNIIRLIIYAIISVDLIHLSALSNLNSHYSSILISFTTLLYMQAFISLFDSYLFPILIFLYYFHTPHI
jgi:hypothetical protein